MTFQFFCKKCDEKFDDYQPVQALKRTALKDLPKDERSAECPTCKNISKERVFSKGYFIGTAVQSAEYNPALGQVVKNSSHRKEIAKQKDLVEVGNDYGSGDKMQKSFDDQRAEKRKRSWDEV